MANPQPDKYTKLSNELLEQFCKLNLSKYEWRVLFSIMRETYGWRKKQKFVSVTRMEQLTNLDRRNVSKAKKQLFKRHLIFLNEKGIGIQKNYDRWVSSIKTIVKKPVLSSKETTLLSSKEIQKLSSKETTYKERKESLKKKEYASVPSSEEIKEASIPKIKDHLTGFSDYLYDLKIFPKVHAFVNTQYKKKINPRAILHALVRVHIKHSIDKTINSWAYAQKIIGQEDGNYNAYQYGKTEGKDL